MSVNTIIMFIMAVGVLIGGVDCILNNRFALGEKFEEGFLCLGPTALSMVGIICLAPKIAELLGPLLVPVYRIFGADPAMFAGILAIDMGGYSLALSLAEDIQIGYFSGILVASTLGATIVFTIPVGLHMLEEQDHVYFAKGLLIGLVPLPFGVFLGGILMGLQVGTILVNLLPILLTDILLALGLIFAQKKMVQGFVYFGRLIKIITLIGLCAAAFEHLTGLILIPGMPPIMEAMTTVAGICIVLLGSLPLITLLLRLLKGPLEAAGGALGLDGASVGGILFSCISVLPVFRIMKDMCPKGKVTVTACMVNTIAVFAAHLGFTAEVQPDLLVPMMTAKLSAGTAAVILALVVMGKEQENRQSEKR